MDNATVRETGAAAGDPKEAKAAPATVTADAVGDSAAAPDTAHSKGSTLIAWVWKNYLRKHTPSLLGALLFMVIEGSCLGALSWMMKPMFDTVFISGNTGAIKWVGLAIISIFVARALASIGEKVLLTKVSQYTAADLRNELLGKLMVQDGSFHQIHPPGFLIQRIQSDVTAINDIWRAILRGAGRDTISLIFLLGVAVSVDWRWTLIALIGAPILVAPSLAVQKFVRARSREARDIGARLAVRLDEIFHGIVPIKLNRLEDYQALRYATLTKRLVRAEIRATFGTSAIPALIDVMSGLGFLGVLVYGGHQIIAGEKTVGEFMSFFTAIGFAFEPLRRLGNTSGIWQVSAAAIERVKELGEMQPKLVSPKTPVPAPKGIPGVRIEGVELSYGDTKVLNGLTFEAPAGKTTALVGASGAGKSTVFNLLTRLIDPQNGRIEIGGVRVQDMELHDLRSLFSVVSQDALLFDDSIRENILLGRTDVPESRLKEVIDAAHVSDFISGLPDGLDTQVGPRGSSLSGGQRQRVAIARALLRNTPILLLDEATSALDAQSEAVVQAALDRLAEGRTTLVIAHRLSTVRDADQIVVMEAGQAVDHGTHEELLARDGIYKHLHDLQFRTDGPTADALALESQIRKDEPTLPSDAGFFRRLAWLFSGN